MMDYKTTLFIFTRDLRIEDNSALIEACKRSDTVIACFILNPKFVNDSFRARFLLDCIEDLAAEFSKRNTVLQILHGDYAESLKLIASLQKIDAIFINEDFTPFAKKRQSEISEFAKQNKIQFHKYIDHLLYDPDLVKTKDGKPYTVFSQFFRTVTQMRVARPTKNDFRNFYAKKLGEKSPIKSHTPINGGRKKALAILKDIENFKDYAEKRNYPKYSTTMLSAHNRFGTISVRELYYAVSDNLGSDHTLTSEIHWKEFFSHILYHFPHVTKNAFRAKYSKIQWKNDKTLLEAWKLGKTGFPIIDAGMRQLNETGFMHNRVRMIVASFLTKDLHIDWKYGERYFAEKLVDYDLAVNNGNWQWIASTGCDAQPWFRIFNPWLQQKKFDPECTYIKKWIPELESLTSEQIHRLENESFAENYPRPIVHHARESKIAKQMFQ